MRGSRGLASLALVALTLGAGVAAAKPPEDDGPPAPPPAFLAETVVIHAEDGTSIPATYGAAGSKPGAPAVVLIPMEGSARGAFEPLYPRLQEFRVPWIAIDHRAGTGADAAQNATVAADAWAAVRYLVEQKGHDPARIGLMGAGVGAVAAVRCAREHPKDVSAIALMTPHFMYPGYDLAADAHALPGALDVLILSAAQDMDRPAVKQGPRHLVYLVKYDRDAPKDTPLDERIRRRRGIPPRQRAFDCDKAVGTAMIAAIQQMDAWLAGWWARRLGTLPNAVLFDGRVDKANDFADPGWDAGAVVKGSQKFDARALRWGRRLMVGGEAPRDAISVRLRVRASRGDAAAGQLAAIDLPTLEKPAALFVSRLQQMGGRASPIETAYLAMPPDEVRDSKGKVAELLNPCFEVEFRLPEVGRKGPYEVRVAIGFLRSAGGVEEAVVDLEKPETWIVVPDSDEPPPAEKPPAGTGAGGAKPPK